MDKIKEFFDYLEVFLTNIPKVILWILMAIGFVIPNPFGLGICLIIFVLFCFNKN